MKIVHVLRKAQLEQGTQELGLGLMSCQTSWRL